MTHTAIIIGIADIFIGVITIALCIPLLTDKIPMNRWYGIRFRKSYESEEDWYRINRYGAQRMILWSVIIIVIGLLALFVPLSSKGVLQLVMFCAPLILFIPVIESWLYARKL